jgi:hypothetical protein
MQSRIQTNIFFGVPPNPTAHLAGLPAVTPLPTDDQVAQAILASTGTKRRMQDGDATSADLVTAEKRKRHFMDASIAADIAAGGYIGVQAQAIGLQVTAALNAPNGALSNMQAQILQMQNQMAALMGQLQVQMGQLRNQVGQLQNQVGQLQNGMAQLWVDSDLNFNASQLAEARYCNVIGLQPLFSPSVRLGGVVNQPPFPFNSLVAFYKIYLGYSFNKIYNFMACRCPMGYQTAEKGWCFTLD